MNIYLPIFIPVYMFLVVFLIWWASSLAWREIELAPAGDETRASPNGKSWHEKISWPGITIVLLGFGIVRYIEFSKQYQHKPFTWAEVAKHKTMEDGVWLVVAEGNVKSVFDVTDFVRKHPAGAKIILQNSGKDATKHFAYHLEATKHFWRRAKIGWISEPEA